MENYLTNLIDQIECQGAAVDFTGYTIEIMAVGKAIKTAVANIINRHRIDEFMYIEHTSGYTIDINIGWVS